MQATKANGGRIADDVLKGAPVPGIGDANEINASIFAASAPAVLEKPFKTDKGWEIVKVEEKQAQRQKSFEEVQQQVAMQLLRQKREEVQRDYIKEMMDKHQVVIHTVGLRAGPAGNAQGDAVEAMTESKSKKWFVRSDAARRSLMPLRAHYKRVALSGMKLTAVFVCAGLLAARRRLRERSQGDDRQDRIRGGQGL